MRSTIVEITRQRFDDVVAHLAGGEEGDEQAAFLFANTTSQDDRTVFRVIDFTLVNPCDFEAQSPFYLELRDATRASIIKQAHDLGASIVECHSHPHGSPRFSWSDKVGLGEFVPHVRWRLSGRPYAAIVVAPTGCDGVAWTSDQTRPDPVLGITVDDRSMLMTGWSSLHWEEIGDEREV